MPTPSEGTSAHAALEVRLHDPSELGLDASALSEFLSVAGPLAVVDLETTGLPGDPASEIIELGIVLFDSPSAPVATAQAFVRPAKPLPLLIQRLTGLTDADLEDAPRIEELAPEVAKLLGERTLVAHNAAFERNFLSRRIDRRFADAVYLDTIDLLALTHPDAPDLRLESFTRALLGTEEQHRALEDALDTARVLSSVAQGARAEERRYLTARRAATRYAPDSPWLALLGKDLVTVDDADVSPYVAIGPSDAKPVPFDEDAIAEALADEERGRRYLPGYRVREEQIALARRFAATLRDGGTLVLEGGTGVGKSLAYLAAAIPFAMERAAGGIHEPILISTRTKLLQDQLLHKDIAAAARFLGYPELRALSIKGRANYTCERRLAGVLAEGAEPQIFEEQRLAYAVLQACARTRPHGEVGALPGALVRRYPALRDLLRRSVAARSEHCSREQCGKQRDCPFGRRRRALGKAHLVVANHDLLLLWPPDYPSFTHCIVDEGHELSGVVDEVYANVVRPDELLERIDDLFGRPMERPGRGGRRARGAALLPKGRAKEAERDVRAWRRGLHLDLTSLGRVLGEHASEYGELQLPVGADRHFPEACELAEAAADRLERVADEAEALDAAARSEREAEGDGEPDGAADEGPSDVERAAAELRMASDGLRQAFRDFSGDAVSAFEGLSPPYDRWRLATRAVVPAPAFHSHFLDKLESLSVVSASLFVSGDEFASLGELELEGRGHLPVERASEASPFPYAKNMRVAALRQPGDPIEETTAILAQLARELGGRTLGLFTSLRRMNDVAERLDRELRGEGYEILAPRRASDDPAALVERFTRAHGGAILLGARTFWQGLDIPGEDLQAVVIEKLPFEVPTELRKRREARIREHGGDPFERYALGKMLLHLKQMSGRLIRSESDRGIVVIVDARPDKRYFAKLRQALPPESEVRLTTRDGIRDLLAEIGLP